MPVPQSAKSKLIDQLSSVQILGLIIVTAVFGYWLQRSVHQIVRTQMVGDNHVIAAQMLKMISGDGASKLSRDSQEWTQVQELIEQARLPNDGYMCIIDAESGALLCHPRIRQNQRMQQKGIGKLLLVGSDERQCDILELRERYLESSSVNSEWFTGRTGSGDNTQTVTATYMPSLDATLLVHQQESQMRRAVRSVLIPSLVACVFLVFAIIAMLKRLIVNMLNGYESQLEEVNAGLEETVRKRTESLVRTRDTVVFGLAKLSESRDHDTGAHLERIRTYVTILAQEMAGIYSFIDKDYIATLSVASSLHDIGKVGVPDAVLLKKGRLTDEERAIIQDHTRMGRECLEAIGARLGEDNFLQIAADICAAHHEKWDGTGYPNGLAGTAIPLPARIVALADVYDALRSRRPYKDPMSHEKTVQLIVDGRGEHFDPQVVDCFVNVQQDFEDYSTAFENAEPITWDLPDTGNRPEIAADSPIHR